MVILNQLPVVFGNGSIDRAIDHLLGGRDSKRNCVVSGL